MSALPRQPGRFAPLRHDELESVSAIEQTVYAFPWSSGNFSDSLTAGYSCWTCHVGDVLAGYAVLMIAADEAHLLNLSIAAPWQGRGLGTALLAFLLRLSRERHCARVLLEVRQSNLGAQRLYARHGFVRIGARKHYYPERDGREDAIVLEHSL